MSNITGKLEDLINPSDKSNLSLEKYEQRENSRYWIHRTSIDSLLFFNTNFRANGLPLILSEGELTSYYNQGKEIRDCILIKLFYNDEESRTKILNILNESEITEDDFEELIVKKLSEKFKSFFEKGLYIADVYGHNLDRTATQYSPEKLRETLNTDNFGFNGYRGSLEAAIVLDIDPDHIDEIYESLPEPIECATEYYNETKVSSVVSPKYIKGLVYKFGNKTFYIKNPKFVNTREQANEQNDIGDTENYLYQTEQLFELALQNYFNSELLEHEKAELYVRAIVFIEERFRHYARITKGFVFSPRYKEVIEYIKTMPRYELYKYDTSKGDFINQQQEKQYYMDIANELNSLNNDSGGRK